MKAIELVLKIKKAGWTPTIVDVGNKIEPALFKVGVKVVCMEDIWFIAQDLLKLDLAPYYDPAKGFWFGNVDVDAESFDEIVKGDL